MNICIYLRKSRSEENMSIEEVLNRHRTTLLAYAKKHKLNVLEIKEEVLSGESITRRPKMLELLEEVEEGKYDAVLVMDIDRLGRGNMREQGLILETFKEYNTKIITPNKVYDLDNEFDEEYSEFEAFMSRRELKIIKKRLMRGRLKSLEEGNYIGAIAPFGYEKKGKTLAINKKQAKVVKLIFQLYIKENYGDSKIASYLIDKKIPTASENLNWDKTTIRTILKNPVYTGKVIWGKKRFKYDKEGNKHYRLQNEEDWLIYEGKHEAIIDPETFQEAQKIAKKRHNPTKTHKTKELRNPLAGLLKCGSCGSTMTIRTQKNKPDSIRCYKNCGGVKSSYIHLIEKRLLENLLAELNKLKFTFSYKKRTINEIEIQVIENTLLEKEKNSETLMEQRDKLYDFLEQGIYDNDTFLERMNILTQKINAVDSAIQQLQTNLSKILQLKNQKEKLIPQINISIDFIEETYFDANTKQRNDFLKSIISEVIYTKDKKAAETEFSLKIKLKM
ncbi:recombinase family protein [Alkaliphilus hydrothermalis]|uniref:DNA invertase Pin-like site-specific DNA recombinase n=1 Tax=Alkaliphilus hydrothermalis TaxID=1482730 RepID=A0ABS2NTT0_9FIRM|nr:recombinase family protein [Alkaliphilus hydrothermalis]MBM7616316.1 DNA invertase Pin-like site-specific DNA recombinase [Alkaliphilus hydrothermalis]